MTKSKDYLDRAIARITEEDQDWSFDKQQQEELAEKLAKKEKNKKCDKPSCDHSCDSCSK